MTHPSGDWLAGLDPDPWERLQLDEVLDEIEAEEAAGLPYGSLGEPGPGEPGPGDPDPGGESPEPPWDDLAQLQAIGQQLDQRHASEAERVAADITDGLTRRPSSEQKLARGLQRIGDGTYTPDPYFRGDPAAAAAARDPLGRYASACGPLDDFGRCASRYHEPGCHTVTEGAAATGSATEAEAWRDTLNGRTPDGGLDAAAIGLANPATPRPGDGIDGWADLLEDRGPAGPYEDLRAAMMAEMSVADRPAPPPREGPDVSGIRAALGI